MSFKTWLESSACNGTVYHGTDRHFDAFMTKPGFPPGFAFTTIPEVAARYARRAGNEGSSKQVIAAKLDIKTPFVVPENDLIEDWQTRIPELAKQGYDGLMQKKKYSVQGQKMMGEEWQAFDPSQIEIISRNVL